MTKKITRNDIVWTIRRSEYSNKYSGQATVEVMLHTVGFSDAYNHQINITGRAYDGKDFSDSEFRFSIDTSSVDEAQLNLDIVKAFIGRTSDITYESVVKALAATQQGFYDRRVDSWQSIDKAQIDSFEPYFPWYNQDIETESLKDLRQIYGSGDIEELKKSLVSELLRRDRFDILEYWGLHEYELYKQVNTYESYEPISVSSDGIFSAAPHRKQEEIEETETEE